ncbi:MAG: hypothetical protein ACFE9L_18880 [Candidatus Hodarchaeota archaeon]
MNWRNLAWIGVVIGLVGTIGGLVSSIGAIHNTDPFWLILCGGCIVLGILGALGCWYFGVRKLGMLNSLKL